MPSQDLPIILYHYMFSPVGRRIIWYMTLRNIPYTHCLQPLALPRPDIARIGVSYRRIPILAIGRDIYLDSRLIIRKLEELYPPSAAHPSLSGKTGDQRAIERLLDVLMSDSGIFNNAIQLLPLDFPPLSDPDFLKDRAELAGIVPGKIPPPQTNPGPGAKLERPTAAAEIRDAMELLETTLLADGRDWVLKTDRPMLADIEAVWLFEWMLSMGSFPPDVISPEIFPKIFAWIDRLSKIIKEKAKTSPAEEIKGDVAASKIFDSGYAEREGVVENELVATVQGLKKGDLVSVYPTDNGFLHKDTGALVSLNSKEVVIEVEGENGNIRVHAPRHKFAVEAA
ncbi:hypothetical protein TWF481_001252 [Arthrobotrys musiformis]|uniref:GST C-terminal domain-containing protein n=1 Tax=Arthrobotrys musiformis TaxID=47236 RepID=A0AAV9WR17_9PEZI